MDYRLHCNFDRSFHDVFGSIKLRLHFSPYSPRGAWGYQCGSGLPVNIRCQHWHNHHCIIGINGRRRKVIASFAPGIYKKTQSIVKNEYCEEYYLLVRIITTILIRRNETRNLDKHVLCYDCRLLSAISFLISLASFFFTLCHFFDSPLEWQRCWETSRRNTDGSRFSI